MTKLKRPKSPTDEKELRVSIKLSPELFMRIEAIKKEWGLEKRGEVVGILLCDLLEIPRSTQ